MTHTPVPWRIQGRVYPTADLHIESQELGLRVVDCVCGASDEECCANAEFICRAVNSHDDLLAMCEELLPIHQCVVNALIDGQGAKHRAIVERLRAEIAKAKGEV